MLLQVNYKEELEPYLDHFPNYRLRGNKLQSCSPFRSENKPSFAVNLDTGVWIDSGATDSNWYKGNFIKLLSFLMQCTYDESKLYLNEKYNLFNLDVDTLALDLNLATKTSNIEKVPELTSMYTKYLTVTRGISEPIQDLFKTSGIKGAVAFPIQDPKGNLVNIKYRKTTSKIFWYENKMPIKQYLYGMYQVLEAGFEYCYVVEGEIDALTIWCNGLPAVATFGASITPQQVHQLRKLKKVIIAGDNDAIGRRFNDKLVQELLSFVELKSLKLCKKYKDINEIPNNLQKQILTRSVFPVFPNFL